MFNNRKWIWAGAAFAGMLAVIMFAGFVFLAKMDFSSLKPWLERRASETLGREVSIEGGVNLELGLPPALHLHDINVANAGWAAKKPLGNIERFTVRAALWPLLTGKVLITDVSLQKPMIQVQVNHAGQSNLDFLMDLGQASQKNLPFRDIQITSASVQNATISYRDARAQMESFTCRLARVDARKLSDSDNLKIEIVGTLGGRNVALQGTHGSLQSLLDPSQLWHADLQLESGRAKIGVRGTIMDPLSLRGLKLHASADIPDASQYFPFIPEPAPINFNTHLSGGDNRTYSFDNLQLKLGKNGLKGHGKADLKGSKPALRFQLAADRLQATSWLNAFSDNSTQALIEIDKVSNNTFSLQWLNSCNAELDMDIGNVAVNGMTFEKVAASSKLHEGRLEVNVHQAEVGQGHLEAEASIEPSGDSFEAELTMDMSSVRLKPFLQKLNPSGSLEGRLHIGTEMKSRGQSPRKMVSNMTGQTKVVLGQGKMAKSHLKGLKKGLRSELEKLFAPSTQTGDTVDLHCLIAHFKCNNGKAFLKTFLLDTGYMIVQGSGQVDLTTGELSVSFDPKPAEGLETGLAGELSFSIAELSKPFMIGGTISNPDTTIDPSGMAAMLGKAAAGGLLLGPAGLAAGLISFDSVTDNPCLKSLKKIRAEEAMEAVGKKRKADDGDDDNE